MNEARRDEPRGSTKLDAGSVLIEQYGCGPIRFSGADDALYERHLLFDDVVAPDAAGPRERFTAIARSIRDVLSQRWVRTEAAYAHENPKRVYYLSMEFLIGRSLSNNVMNLLLDPIVKRAAEQRNLDWLGLIEEEPDAGLGNGGLGRLAACFLDSMATMQLPAMGYGLRYEYGIFKQSIRDGWQLEEADNWLRDQDPWEVARPNEKVELRLNCSFAVHEGTLQAVAGKPSTIIGLPFDRPVVGYGGKTINTLRLWAAAAPDFFDFQEFSSGDFVAALAGTLAAESLTRVLYPDDSTSIGRALRFVQEYFLVACSLADLVRRFRQNNADWSKLPDKVAIQLNDTHPAMAVPELMRILLDEARLGWDEAWEITQMSLAYTNHTLLPEALEKWPLAWFEILLPRHLEIVFEINRRFRDAVQIRFPGDQGRVERMSVIEEDNGERKVRMADLAIVGSHSTNGVAAIHSELLRTRTVKDLADMFPERFNNKTNGVTPRRWLLLANPALARAITEAVGDGWITDLGQLRKLSPLAGDKGFCDAIVMAKRQAKLRFVDWLKSATGQGIDPDTIFDCQIKRIHEYKRQLLNALRIIVLYQRLRENPTLEVPPRTFLFAGKAAPSYRFAKLTIKFINNLAGTIDGDPVTRGRLNLERQALSGAVGGCFMTVSPLAGKPAPKEMLVDLVRLEHEYYARRPDPDDPGERVSFGTSGHRGSPLRGSFTEAHILAIAQAICDYRRTQRIGGPLYMGKDTHALSGPAQRTALEVLAANGVGTIIQRADGFTPTPVISRAILVHNRGCREPLADGIVVTPSHNPPEDGGFKYNPPHGGPADTDVTRCIENRANALLRARNAGVKRLALDSAGKTDGIREQDLLLPYIEDLRNVVDMEAIRSAGLSLAVDPLGGAAVAYWEPINRIYGLDIAVVNPRIDPTFSFMTVDHDGVIRMDCSSPYAMARLVDLKDRYRVAFANDADADRHGIVAPSAGLMNPNHYLAVAIDYLLAHRPDWPASAVIGKTLVSSGMIDRVVQKHGRRLLEVPVGFKWFAPGLFDGSCCFAGEESAGASFLRRDGSVWTTDKDGLIMNLLAAEITARTGKDPGECYCALAGEFGRTYYARIDAPATPHQKQQLARLSPEAVEAPVLAGEPIIEKLTRAPGNGAAIGGLKVVARNGWFAARPSGTEAVYKIYAESFRDERHLEAILQDAQRIVSRAAEG